MAPLAPSDLQGNSKRHRGLFGRTLEFDTTELQPNLESKQVCIRSMKQF